MTKPTAKRNRELSLLLPILAVVFIGLALVFNGKLLTTPVPHDAININTATSRQFARALEIGPNDARAIVEEREKRHGREFSTVDEFKHLKILKGLGVNIGDRFIARSRSQVSAGFWQGVLFFGIAFLLAHILLRWIAPQSDPILLPIVTLLSGLGLIMVYSVKDPFRDTQAFAGQVLGVAGFGLIALLIPLTKPFGKLILRRYQYVYAVGAIGLMIMLFLFGNGPGRIHIQLFGFEPVEIIKVLLVFFVVAYLIERRGLLDDPTSFAPRLQDFGPLAAMYASTLFIFVMVKDLGPAVLLFGTFLILLYLATNRKRYPLLGVTLLIFAGIIGYKIHLGFFATRVTMWLNPWHNADKHGAQLAQGLWGMATGGLFGSGLGLGHPDFMPRSGSDLIFASIGEELGLVGTLCVLILYTFLILRGFRIAKNAVTEFDRLLASGLTTLLALQTMIIVGGVTGLIPLTGITLPFISFGKSSLVANFFVIGMLLNLSQKTLPPDVADKASVEWIRGAKRLSMGMAAYLLIGIGIARLFVIQGVLDTQTATRLLYTPDRDGVSRPHTNPRLLAFAANIRRGEIRDRNGVVLARDAGSPDAPGVVTVLNPDGHPRIYPGGAACAHLLYAVESPRSAVNPLGRNGVLRGYESYSDLLSDYRLQYLPGGGKPVGRDVTLTIDAGLQRAASSALHDVISNIRDRRTGRRKQRGAAVVLDVKTGEILAAVSSPTFTPGDLTYDNWANLLNDGDGQSTLLNRATSGLYPPGSTFKIVTATAGLENNLANQSYACAHVDTNVHWKYNGHYYSRRRITDDTGMQPHGQPTMADALRVSCNIYFAHLAIDLGPDLLDSTARNNYQLAHMPSVTKMGEDLPDCGYGQGAVLVTPLEMANVGQAVANNGELLPAKFFKDDTPTPQTQALTPANAAAMQQMLAQVTLTGTAAGVFNGLKVSVAGKTGSAQNNHGDQQTHSWFVGYAPAISPTIAFSCIVENGGFGRAAAAPVCREIVRRAF